MIAHTNPCDTCGDTTALSIYDDHTFCHKCHTHSWLDEDQKKERKPMKEKREMLAGGEYKALKGSDEFYNRGLDQDVCEKFGVKMVGTDKIILPYYNTKGEYIGQKVRIKDKYPKGVWYGDTGKTFFGQHLWTSGPKLTICEGEFDALAIYQMFGKKWPVVSLRNGADKTGAGPLQEFEANFEFLRNFDEIILCFDSDEPGIASANTIAERIPMGGKLKIMQMHKHKDANEYLLKGDTEVFRQEFYNARAHLPQDIVYGTELRDRILQKLKDRKERNKVQYPWKGLNGMTYGIRTGEMVTLISGTGMGKSCIVGELIYHLLMNTEEKLGLFMLEESVEMANLRLASLHAKKPLHLPDTEWSDEEIIGYLEDTVELKDANGNPRVISFDHFGSNGINELLFRIDHMVALGCKYIFLDHISIVVSDQSHGDERKALDEIATKLRTKIQEHDVGLFVVSHLRRTAGKPHEEGGQTSLADIRGTQAIAQLSDMVLGLERNGQAEDEIERNTTNVRTLKNRFAGTTGLACSLHYDKVTGRLKELNSDEDPPSTRETVESPAKLEPKSEPLPDEFWENGDELPESFMAAG